MPKKKEETGAAERPDPKSYTLDTGVKNVIVVDGLKVVVASSVYRLLVMLDKKAKSGSKAKSAAK
jgi:hypothetical protein